MALQKKILDDQKKIFSTDLNKDSVVDMLIKSFKGGKDTTQMSEIEKRQYELDTRLYELANKHRSTFKDLEYKGYKMPDPNDEDEETVKDKKAKLLSKRYEEDKTTLTEQEQWEIDQQKKVNLKKQKKDDYQLILDNQVDFVQTQILDGIL